MLGIRTIVLVILWVGLMAGAGSAALDNNVGSVILTLGVFIVCWLMIGDYVRDVVSRTSDTPPRPNHRYSKRQIALLREEYDNKHADIAIAAGADFFIDSYGRSRDPFTGEHLYMNSTNTPNRDVFADYPRE